MQMSLFNNVKSAYAKADSALSNSDLYQQVAKDAGLSADMLSDTHPIGESGALHNKVRREIRWHQQTLKHAGLLKRTDARGRWELTRQGKVSLRKAQPKASMVAFSTKLGAALWSLSQDVFDTIDTPITLCLTSPPYPLRTPRAYGNPKLSDYIEFIVESIRPIAKNLVAGGSICLNLSNDIFESGTSARSLYREKLVIALAEELELWKIDELIWANPCKPPGPIQWASKSRQQLNTGYECIYWFTNSPENLLSDNRRVLQPHSDRHLSYIRSGGAKASQSHSDGAYSTRRGAYSVETAGKIPRNVLLYPHNCPSQSQYKNDARKSGLPVHGAPYPLQLAEFLIRLMTREGDLVVDPFAGSLTTGVGAENLGRRWLITECMWEYAAGGATRFAKDSITGLHVNPDFLQATA